MITRYTGKISAKGFEKYLFLMNEATQKERERERERERVKTKEK